MAQQYRFSLFAQRLDLVAFVAYFLGAVVPLGALVYVTQKYLEIADLRTSYQLADLTRQQPSQSETPDASGLRGRFGQTALRIIEASGLVDTESLRLRLQYWWYRCSRNQNRSHFRNCSEVRSDKHLLRLCINF